MSTVWYVVEAPFYLPVTNSATVTIAPRPLTVVVDSKTKVYGTTDPASLREAELPRVYTVYGKISLGDKDWTPVTVENMGQMRFFQVRVALP